MIVGVRSAGVVEARDIGEQTLIELVKELEAAAIQFLFFQILEKALHDSVVIGVTLGGKGLILFPFYLLKNFPYFFILGLDICCYNANSRVKHASQVCFSRTHA